jgi:AbrB family looped-hinge helix DNA binding protein
MPPARGTGVEAACWRYYIRATYYLERTVATVITVKGQVTIPVDIRRALGIGAGDALEFREEQGRYYLHPVRRRVADAFGRVKLKRPVSDSQIEAAIAAGGRRDQ